MEAIIKIESKECIILKILDLLSDCYTVKNILTLSVPFHTNHCVDSFPELYLLKTQYVGTFLDIKMYRIY